MREREDANRTREAGHLDEIQGSVASTPTVIGSGAVRFIDWLDARSVVPSTYHEIDRNRILFA